MSRQRTGSPIPVPALVEPEVFAAVQEQLQENKRHARQSRRGALYLLQGLLQCQHCGYAFYGKRLSPSARKGKPRAYAYYRCLGTDAYRFGGERRLSAIRRYGRICWTGIVSPILSTIYLDQLDRFVETTLMPDYTKGDKRERNPAYGQVANQLQTARRQGDLERVRALQKELRKHPSKTQDDPGYRRLRYIRYADDFLFGFAGPFEEAHQIKDKIASFLQTELKLTLSAEKTLITHAQTGRARFLGYEIGIMYSPTKLDRSRRSVNGAVGMYIPEDVIQAKRKRYLRDGKPIHRPELQNDSEYDIIIRYQGEYRGLVQYYALAQNLAQLGYVKWTMETSLLKTLASKNQTSTTKESKRLNATTKTPDGPRKCLQLTIQREKKKPLIAIFGGLPLKRRKNPVIEDRVIRPYVQLRSEIVERLLNDTCEVCGGKANIQMHHVRHLRDLNKKGKREMPLWMKVMISRKRKSIPLCKGCHDDVHFNRPKLKR